MFKIFTFYRKDKSNTCIHIAALTVMEAANALYELDNFSQIHYNIHEFKMEHINVFPILNIDEDYSGLPYILSEEQYEYVVSEHRKQQKDNKFERNVIDKSNVKYNTAIPINTKMDKMDNAISRIDKANNEYKIPLKNKPKIKKNNKEIKLDQSLNDTLNNLKNDTMDVLMKYMHQFNNKETRDNICNDLTKLLTEKYSNLMNDIDEVEEKNKNTNKTKLIVDNALSMLQNKIKGED